MTKVRNYFIVTYICATLAPSPVTAPPPPNVHIFEYYCNISISNISFWIRIDPQPTITLLIRNGFGRHAWTLQLRHLPRHRSTTKQSHSSSMTTSTGRPISMVEASCIPDVHQRYFPDCINRIEAYKAYVFLPHERTYIYSFISSKLHLVFFFFLFL